MRFGHLAFRFRSFMTLVLFLSLLAAAASGIALYLRPEGSLARWINWTFLGLDKKQWEAAHIMMVLLFLLSSIVHVWYNWRPLTSYLRSRAVLIFPSGSRLPLMRELLAVVAVVMIFLGCTVLEWQPCAALIDLRAEIKVGRLSAGVRPPVPDADRLTFSEFCRAAALDEQKALQSAKKRGVVIEDRATTIAEIAKENRISAEGVYQAMQVACRSGRWIL
jgi:hypothetical protein